MQLEDLHELRDYRVFFKHLCPLLILFVTVFRIFGNEFTPLAEQPFPDAISYTREAVAISEGNGFKVDFDERLGPSGIDMGGESYFSTRYPPGFPLALALFALIGGEGGVQWGSRFVVVLLVIAVAVLAFAIGGALASCLASVFVAISPFATEASTLVLSDAFGALLTLLALGSIIVLKKMKDRGKSGDAILLCLGAICGFAVFSRIALVTLLIGAMIVFPTRKSLRLIVLGASPFLIVLAGYQLVEFGAPWRTGYSMFVQGEIEFSLAYPLKPNLYGERGFIFSDRLGGSLMRWTCPCDEYGPMGKAPSLLFYPAVGLGFYWVFFPPFVGLAAIASLVWKRRESSAKFATVIIFLNLLMTTFYFYQGARLFAPAAYLLLLFGSIGLAVFINRVLTRFRGLSFNDSDVAKPILAKGAGIVDNG